MAGVREDLILDITSAQRSIDALEAQLSSAFADVNVTVDTAGVSNEISRAVTGADSTTRIEADTTGISTEISRAVDVADTSVNITADTTAARGQVRALDTDIKAASGSAKGLGIALTGAGLLLGARGLFSLAEASSAVNEQVTGSEIVFGRAAIGVQRFADQADRIGLANVQALQLSNTFGQLARSAGLSEGAVSDFATTIVERGADIASLRDIDLTQTLDALRSGLVGETEPLRNIGIFINEASVQTEAYRLGLAQLGEELTDAQKIQARYSLILEQSEIAAGNFALTQDGLANTQRQIRAELADLAADAGRLLEPTFLNLAQITRDDLLPSLAELAEEALPSIGRILEALAPVLGITVDLLVAGAPILETTADVLEAIPAPLIAIAAGYLAWSRAMRIVNAAREAEAVQVLASNIGNLGTGLGALGSVGAGRFAGAAAVVGLVGAVGVAASTGPLNSGDFLGDLAGGLVKLGDSFTHFGADRTNRVSEEVAAITEGLDLTDLNQAKVGLTRLTESLQEVGDARKLFDLGPVHIWSANDGAENAERLNQIEASIDAINTQARTEAEAGIETGRWTEAQLTAARAGARREDSSTRAVRALELLRAEEERAARNAEGIIDKYTDVAAAYVGVADALGRIRVVAPEVESIVAAIRTSGDRSEFTFLNLATAIDQAGLSGEDLGDVAAALGISTNSLSSFVDGLTESLEGFIETAVDGLPTVSDVLGGVQEDVEAAAGRSAQAVRDAAEERAAAVLDATNQRLSDGEFGEAAADRIRKAGDDRAQAIRDAGDAEASAIEENARVSVSQFAKGLRDQAAELADFRSDLEALTGAGFGDVAGLLAQQGFEAGDAFADELAAALEAGNTEIIETLRSSNEAFEEESLATVDFIRDELAPEFLSATGLLASAITEGFGAELDFEEKVRIAAELARAELDPQAEQIAAVAATKGEAAARAFGEALKFDKETIRAGIEAGNAIAGVDEEPFQLTGSRLGDAMVDGFLAALLQRETEVSDKSAQLALAAEHGARKAAEIESPSKVWARIGGHMGAGLVGGLAASIPAVAAAGARTVASAVPTFGTRDFALPGRATSDGVMRLHPDDIKAIGQMRPNRTAVVHNPVASVAEQSIRRELKSAELLDAG